MSAALHAFPPDSPSAIIFELGTKLADAMNALAKLSAIVKETPAAVTLPARQRSTPAPTIDLGKAARAPREYGNRSAIKPRTAAPPVPVTSWLTPVPLQERVKQVRRQGAADRIVAALLSPKGVLASELREIAGYPCGPTVLDRLAQSRGFTWYEIGAGTAERRFKGEVPKPIPQRVLHAALRRA